MSQAPRVPQEHRVFQAQLCRLVQQAQWEPLGQRVVLVYQVLKDSLVMWVLRATRAYLVLQPIQVQRGLRGHKVLQERQCRPVLRVGRVRLGLQARRV